MFDYTMEILISFAENIPVLIPVILIFNLIAYLLWGGKNG